MTISHVDHVLSTRVMHSAIFADLIGRAVSAAPSGRRVTCSVRPDPRADIHHYHRPNLERRLRARSVVTVHHDPRETEPWLALPTFLPRYREARLVHCLNSTQRAVLAEHGIAQVEVVPHGVDRSLFPIPAAPRRVPEGRLRLGIVSRRYARGVKGEALLAALLPHLDPARIEFVLAGRGRWQDSRLIRDAGFTVETFEQLPYRLLPAVYARIDALLILSRFEGGPASLPEALGSGIPVLSTRVGMCADLIRDGENGFLLEGRPQLDGERIASLAAGDRSGLAALARGAFAGAAAIPSWDHVLARLHGCYGRIDA